MNQHHTPDQCVDCHGPLTQVDRPHYGEPFYWCPRDGTAHICACDGCIVLRTLASI